MTRLPYKISPIPIVWYATRHFKTPENVIFGLSVNHYIHFNLK